MSQGWTIDATAETISFFEAPPAGTGNIVVKEFARGAVGGTDVWAVGVWSERYGYPREVEFFADRLWFAGTPTEPQRVDASNIADYRNFGRSSPIVDSDAVSFTVNARQVNAIMDLVPLDNLIVLTTGGVWKTTGGADDVITPSTIGIKPQSYHGVGTVPAKVIGESAIFVEEQGQRIRDLVYTFEKDGFRGNDISIWADHLFTGYRVMGIEHMSAPWPVLWFPRNDGRLIGCTYLPEQEVAGWHRHDTGGSLEAEGEDKFLDVCCLPGDDETEQYVLVERVIEGVARKYIERRAPTRAPSQEDEVYMDSALTYDGRNTGSTTLTLSIYNTPGWNESSRIRVTASTNLFSASDVGDGFEFTVDGKRLRLVIDEYIQPDQVVTHSIGDVAPEFREVALTSWTFQRDAIGGLSHLEGREVVILADGTVHPKRVVDGGVVHLNRPYGVVTVGLGYPGVIETLDLNSPGGEPIRSQKKLIVRGEYLFRDTRGIKAGPSLDQLDEIPQRHFEDYDEPIANYTGTLEVNFTASWDNESGRNFIVSDDPLPCEILSLTLRGSWSD